MREGVIMSEGASFHPSPLTAGDRQCCPPTRKRGLFRASHPRQYHPTAI